MSERATLNKVPVVKCSKMRVEFFIVLIITVFCTIYLHAVTAEKEKEELKIEVVEKPEKCPQKTKVGDSLAMHYTGRLVDGKKFDSSHDRGQTFDFTLGKGMVIQGWEQGLLDMCVGEKRKLTIPPHLGKVFVLSTTLRRLLFCGVGLSFYLLCVFSVLLASYLYLTLNKIQSELLFIMFRFNCFEDFLCRRKSYFYILASYIMKLYKKLKLLLT